MITRLEEVDPIRADQIDEAMFLGDAAGPRSRRQVLQWFRFADPHKWIAYDGLDEVEHSQRDGPICRHPEAKVLAELWMKDRFASPGPLRRRSRPRANALSGGQSPSLGGGTPVIVAVDDASGRAAET